jgi:hypothetical protein
MWWWIAAGILVVILVPVAIVVVPILTHVNQGSSGQADTGDDWPLTVTATGDDGRTRVLSVASEDGAVLDTSAIKPGDRIVVSGSGYDGGRGIYVAICAVMPEGEKPHPCLGGVPDQEQQDIAEGTIQWAPSNWINDDWAWKLFGARSYDDEAAGTFTAYLEVGDPVGDGIDCRTEPCAIYTRNDHTALNDRVQDLHIPVGFVPAP